MSDWIVTDPQVLGGKPCIRGTRISVELILELFATGASREDIERDYPQVTRDGLGAALSYAAKAMKNEVIWDIRVPA